MGDHRPEQYANQAGVKRPFAHVILNPSSDTGLPCIFDPVQACPRGQVAGMQGLNGRALCLTFVDIAGVANSPAGQILHKNMRQSAELRPQFAATHVASLLHGRAGALCEPTEMRGNRRESDVEHFNRPFNVTH
jgi:hypothetical protein